MFVNPRSSLHRRSSQPGDVACRIQSGADFIHHAAVINARPDLCAQFATLYHAQLMLEFACDHFRLPRIIVEVLLLAGDFQVSATREVAVDALFAHDLLDAIDRVQRRRIHAPGTLAPVPRDELVHSQLHAREHHAAVARTRAPADGLAFQHGNFGAALRQRARRGEPREAGADDGDVYAVGKRAILCLGEFRGGEPVVVFLRGHRRLHCRLRAVPSTALAFARSGRDDRAHKTAVS